MEATQRFEQCLERFDEIRAAARSLGLKVVETADDVRGASMLIAAGLRNLNTNSATDYDRFHNVADGEREAVLEVSRMLIESAIDLAEAATGELRDRVSR
jgi:hypothetical protein